MKIKRNKKSCRKLAYRSKAEARKALNELRHTGVRRYYRCPYCGVWHLTSEEK